jgi:hypothetical protein
MLDKTICTSKISTYLLNSYGANYTVLYNVNYNLLQIIIKFLNLTVVYHIFL